MELSLCAFVPSGELCPLVAATLACVGVDQALTKETTMNRQELINRLVARKMKSKDAA
jgi:hypothetical protein